MAKGNETIGCADVMVENNPNTWCQIKTMQHLRLMITHRQMPLLSQFYIGVNAILRRP